MENFKSLHFDTRNWHEDETKLLCVTAFQCCFALFTCKIVYRNVNKLLWFCGMHNIARLRQCIECKRYKALVQPIDINESQMIDSAGRQTAILTVDVQKSSVTRDWKRESTEETIVIRIWEEYCRPYTNPLAHWPPSRRLYPVPNMYGGIVNLYTIQYILYGNVIGPAIENDCNFFVPVSIGSLLRAKLFCVESE